MGFLKKITRPISRALDKIVPNEIKPALPFLAAAAPFMAPGLMGLGGNTMLSRALISGGLNLGSQLAQEGSDGDFSSLSLAMASGIGALSAPNAASTIRGVDPNLIAPRPAPEGILGQGREYLARGAEFLGPQTGGVTDILGKGGTQAGLNMETLKAAAVPITQGTTDLAIAENRRLMKDYEREMADYEAGMEGSGDTGNRALAIRQSMEAYGFSEDEILAAIEAAGYRAGGRVGYAFGDFVKGSGVAQPVSASMNAGNRPMMSGSGMGGMLSNMINNNPQLFSNLTGQANNSVSNMSRDFIDLNENGIDDRQEKAIGGRVGFEFGGITDAVEAVEETPREFLVDKLKVTVQPGQSDKRAIIEAMYNDVDGVMPEDRKREFYQLYAPQMYNNGEMDKTEFEFIQTEILNNRKNGGRIGAQEGGLMNLGGREMDLRKGGFVPIGKKEKADDVPARLSKNEFVMTADAVRAAGGGSVNEGAKRMYNLMNNLEARV